VVADHGGRHLAGRRAECAGYAEDFVKKMSERLRLERLSLEWTNTIGAGGASKLQSSASKVVLIASNG
jgi:hypothetical protein